MAQFVQRDASKSEETHPVDPIHGPFGSAQGCPAVIHPVMATTTVESRSHSSSRKLEIAEVFSQHGLLQVQVCDSGFLRYIVYADKANAELCWSPTLQIPALLGLQNVSIPNHVRELCDCCFKGCSTLRWVTFGSSSSLEWIGVSCFECSGVEEVDIPDSVRELSDCCFAGCKSLRRVTFGSSPSLERIAISCFASSGVEEANIPDSVRELCDCCFKWCESLCRVTFGSSLSCVIVASNGARAFVG